MPALPNSRLRPFAAALLASLSVGALAEAPLQAQSGQFFSCRTGSLTDGTLADSRPVPRILRYAIAPGTDPAPVGALRENREAIVTGGDDARGWVRIDLQFDTAIPRDCVLPLGVALAIDRGTPGDQIVASRMAEVLDGLDIIAGRPQLMPHLAGALRFTGTGTDTASFRVPIRATTASRPVNHALKLVLAQDYANGLPFSVTVEPLPAFTMVMPAAPLAAGSVTLVRAEQPVRLLPGTAAMPVLFRLSSATLGRWQDAPSATPTEIRGRWDERFTPLRAEARLVAGTSPEAANGTISATFAGRTQSAQVSIAAGPTPAPATIASCDPVFAVTPVAGGLRVSITNRSRGACPVQRVKHRILSKTAPRLSPTEARLALPTGRFAPLASAGTSGSVNFMLDKATLAQLKPGVRFDFDIVAEPATASPSSQKAGLTLSVADIAVITGRQGK